MAGGDALLGERLRNFGDELQQRQTGVDMACALAGLLDQSRDIVTGHVEQALEALRLLVRVDINPLRVLDQLPFLGLCVGEFDDPGGNGEKLRQLRGAEAPRSGNDLEALVVRPDGDGLNQAVVFDGLGILWRLSFCGRCCDDPHDNRRSVISGSHNGQG